MSTTKSPVSSQFPRLRVTIFSSRGLTVCKDPIELKKIGPQCEVDALWINQRNCSFTVNIYSFFHAVVMNVE